MAPLPDTGCAAYTYPLERTKLVVVGRLDRTWRSTSLVGLRLISMGTIGIIQADNRGLFLSKVGRGKMEIDP